VLRFEHVHARAAETHKPVVLEVLENAAHHFARGSQLVSERLVCRLEDGTTRNQKIGQSLVESRHGYFFDQRHQEAQPRGEQAEQFVAERWDFVNKRSKQRLRHRGPDHVARGSGCRRVDDVGDQTTHRHAAELAGADCVEGHGAARRR